MQHIDGGDPLAGMTRAVVTVLRALLDVQRDQDAVWERLRTEYGRAVAQLDASPSHTGERKSFEAVFDMLGIHVAQDSAAGHTHHAAGRSREPDTETVKPTDGVDDASLY